MNEPDAKSLRAVCVGEVVIELKRSADGRFALSCGGDTFNTAVYLARAGIEVAFATAIGDDPHSDSRAGGCWHHAGIRAGAGSRGTG